MSLMSALGLAGREAELMQAPWFNMARRSQSVPKRTTPPRVNLSTAAEDAERARRRLAHEEKADDFRLAFAAAENFRDPLLQQAARELRPEREWYEAHNVTPHSLLRRILTASLQGGGTALGLAGLAQLFAPGGPLSGAAGTPAIADEPNDMRESDR